MSKQTSASLMTRQFFSTIQVLDNGSIDIIDLNSRKRDKERRRIATDLFRNFSDKDREILS